MGIFGLAVAGIAQYYTYHYLPTKIANTTTQHANDIANAMALHMLIFNNFPCPAPTKIAPGQPGAGVGDCTAAGAAPTLPTPPAWNVSNCAWGGCAPIPGAPPAVPAAGNCIAATGICVTPGWRASFVGLNYNGGNPATKDPVLIGSVPYVDLGLSVNDMLDGYHNRFTYAVSFYETQAPAVVWAGGQNPPVNAYYLGAVQMEAYSASAQFQFGGTGISPQFAKETNVANPPGCTSGPTVPPSLCLSNVPGTWMFAVISHGPDGVGAWTYDGNQPHACPTIGGVPPFPNGLDVENCNRDAVFLASLTTPDGNIYAPVQGVQHFDDNVVLNDVSFDRDKWEAVPGSNAMYNNLAGNVGIGQSNPQYPLDVLGNIQVDGSVPNANLPAGGGLLADQICDATGNNCYVQNLIAGNWPSMQCTNSLVTGIANQAVSCAGSLSLTAGIHPGICPSTTPPTVMTGIDASGNIICGAMP